VAMVMGSERSDLGGVRRKDGRRIYFLEEMDQETPEDCFLL
jgi:hypothetical protein